MPYLDDEYDQNLYQRLENMRMGGDPRVRRPRFLYEEMFDENERPSRWQHVETAIPYYGAAIPFLSAGLAALIYGLRGKKRR